MAELPGHRTAGALRATIWLFHLALPLVGLAVLVANPALDVAWEDHGSHFWLVLAVATTNVGLAVVIGYAARRRSDARLYLVALSFLCAAGFLGLHALATPGVLLPGPNAAFNLATPVGLFFAAVFAAVSAFDTGAIATERLRRWQVVLGAAVLGSLIAWAVATLAAGGPFNAPTGVEEVRGPVTVLALAGVALFVVASVGYVRVYRQRPSVVVLSLITAFALLAEALLAQTIARNWRASWWEWHVLMALAFAFVAYSADVQYQREGSVTALFRAVSLEQTVRRIRDEYAAALEEVLAAIERRAADGRPLSAVLGRVSTMFDLSTGQVDLLERAAEALAGERDQARRLAALAAIGREARVVVDEDELVARSLVHLREGFRGDVVAVALRRDGELAFAAGATPPGLDDTTAPSPVAEAAARQAADERRTVRDDGDGGTIIAQPLLVKDGVAGALVVERRAGAFGERDLTSLDSLASQLSIALENAQLYRRIDRLFRQYLSPDVAATLLSHPEQASLGGAIVTVSALFADLRSYTSFAERSSPDAVVALLNRYFERVVPIILRNGGTVLQFVGDAIVAVFNAPEPRPDHAERAVASAVEIHAAVEAVAAGDDVPRFGVGVATGPALVGNIGSAEVRTFTAIGDTINLAARLQASARAGETVIDDETRRSAGDTFGVEPLGSIAVKGKREAVAAWRVSSAPARSSKMPAPVRRPFSGR